MKYVYFSDTNFQVSNLCLGTMNFASRCDYSTSEEIVKYAWEQGVNFFDTATMYTDGEAEKYLGKAVKQLPREKLFIVTKVIAGLDQKSILSSIDESLSRLQMEYVDLYLIHWPVQGMKIMEMMEALNQVILLGKAKKIGVCNFPAYLLAAANGVAAENGWERFCCNQVAYNLIERGVEVEILPQALLEKIAIMTYRPLSMGLLTGKFHHGMAMDPDTRGATDSRVITWLSQHGDSLERFYEFAEHRHISPAQLALSWILYSPAVTAPIIGASSVRQLSLTLKANEVALSDYEYRTVTSLFHTEVKEESMQLFPGTKYNFPRLRRNLFLAEK